MYVKWIHNKRKIIEIKIKKQKNDRRKDTKWYNESRYKWYTNSIWYIYILIRLHLFRFSFSFYFYSDLLLLIFFIGWVLLLLCFCFSFIFMTFNEGTPSSIFFFFYQTFFFLSFLFIFVPTSSFMNLYSVVVCISALSYFYIKYEISI